MFMKKRVVVLVCILLVFSALAFAYVSAEVPSAGDVSHAIKALQKYSYVQTVEFDNYQFVPLENGDVKEVFIYHGKLIEQGHVDLTTMSLEQKQEFYINGTLASKGYIKVQDGKVVEGYMEKGGSRIVLTEKNAAQLTGYDLKRLSQELLKTEPLKVVRKIETITPKHANVPMLDRILIGLGLKEGKFEYEITTTEGQRWIVQVNGNGVPVGLENVPKDSRHPKVIVAIEAQQ